MNVKVYGQQVIPSARRLMKSLRDIGYDFSQAVADLVDNSVDAGATLVSIDVEFDGDRSKVRIADNGKGMTLPQIQEAMRYGSEREYADPEGLGKFGLGLKTASLSQCQRLSVASRAGVEKSAINACCWDLDHVEKTNHWELIDPDEKTLKRILGDHLTDTTGTVVFWENLDRMLGMKHPYGDAAKKRLAAMSRDVEIHLAMVFHRFLMGEIPGRRLSIKLNGNDLAPWDPFARNEPKTKAWEPIKIHVEHEQVAGDIWLHPYILPPEKEFSSPEAHKKASGPANWNLQQGFYIYRANRLIQSGGWCRLRTVDEHLKLSRIALDFSPQLDEAFNVNVAKMRVQFPLHIRDQIGDIIKPINKEAQERYRKNTPKQTADAPSHQPSHDPNHPTTPSSGEVQADSRTKSGGPTDVKYWTLDEMERLLDSNARTTERPVLARVFARIRRKLGIQEG